MSHMRTERTPIAHDLRTDIPVPAEEIQRRSQYLLSLGFADIWITNLQETRPTLYSVESITLTTSGLRERGFAHPNKMIETLPAILGYAFENIDAKLAGLRERGFAHPNKIIETLPAILGYAFENIDAKLAGLRERGFAHPNKMMETLPPILGYAFENIDAKLQYLKKVTTLYGSSFTAQEIIEYFPSILGYKFDKIATTTRIIRNLPITTEEITPARIALLLIQNLESLVLASETTKQGSITELNKAAKTLKKTTTPEERKTLITSLPVSKTVYRYKRGYQKAA